LPPSIAAPLGIGGNRAMQGRSVAAGERAAKPLRMMPSARNHAVRLALRHGAGIGEQCAVLLRLPATLRGSAASGFPPWFRPGAIWRGRVERQSCADAEYPRHIGRSEQQFGRLLSADLPRPGARCCRDVDRLAGRRAARRVFQSKRCSRSDEVNPACPLSSVPAFQP
jgi:hypothetical protein